MNYYSHNIGDYAQATLHLSLVEDAIYSRLLRRYFRRGDVEAAVSMCFDMGNSITLVTSQDLRAPCCTIEITYPSGKVLVIDQ